MSVPNVTLIEHLQLENKKLKQENVNLKFIIYNLDNVSESGNQFCAKTGLTVVSFHNLLEVLNPDKKSCNIKLHDTSSRFSQSFNDIGSRKSGPKPSYQDQLNLSVYLSIYLSICLQLFIYIMTWLKMDLISHIELGFSKFEINLFTICNIEDFLLFFSECSSNLAFKRSNE